MTETKPDQVGLVCVGKVGAPYGVKGWLKIQSYTSPPQSLLQYQPWLLFRPDLTQDFSSAAADSEGSWYTFEQGRPQGKGLVAKFEGIKDRTEAERLVGCAIYIQRSQLPALPEGEFYWIDLIGMQVKNLQDQPLGSIKELLETGANDVLVVRAGNRERLIPYVMDHYVIEVNLPARVVTVDWPEDYD